MFICSCKQHAWFMQTCHFKIQQFFCCVPPLMVQKPTHLEEIVDTLANIWRVLMCDTITNTLQDASMNK